MTILFYKFLANKVQSSLSLADNFLPDADDQHLGCSYLSHTLGFLRHPTKGGREIKEIGDLVPVPYPV